MTIPVRMSKKDFLKKQTYNAVITDVIESSFLTSHLDYRIYVHDVRAKLKIGCVKIINHNYGG